MRLLFILVLLNGIMGCGNEVQPTLAQPEIAETTKSPQPVAPAAPVEVKQEPVKELPSVLLPSEVTLTIVYAMTREEIGHSASFTWSSWPAVVGENDLGEQALEHATSKESHEKKRENEKVNMHIEPVAYEVMAQSTLDERLTEIKKTGRPATFRETLAYVRSLQMKNDTGNFQFFVFGDRFLANGKISAPLVAYHGGKILVSYINISGYLFANPNQLKSVQMVKCWKNPFASTRNGTEAIYTNLIGEDKSYQFLELSVKDQDDKRGIPDADAIVKAKQEKAAAEETEKENQENQKIIQENSRFLREIGNRFDCVYYRSGYVRYRSHVIMERYHRDGKYYVLESTDRGLNLAEVGEYTYVTDVNVARYPNDNYEPLFGAGEWDAYPKDIRSRKTCKAP